MFGLAMYTVTKHVKRILKSVMKLADRWKLSDVHCQRKYLPVNRARLDLKLLHRLEFISILGDNVGALIQLQPTFQAMLTPFANAFKALLS